MDYTTLASVQAEIGPTDTGSAALITSLIPRASRLTDRYLTGRAGDSDDYLKTETRTAEILRGRWNGSCIRTYLRKPLITSCTAFDYRASPNVAWQTGVTSSIVTDGPKVELWLDAYTGNKGDKLFLRLTYTGGLGATVADLPGDIIELTNIFTIRLYREAQAGNSDVIGVSELGQVFYSRAIPDRLKIGLQPYMRVVSWDGTL